MAFGRSVKLNDRRRTHHTVVEVDVDVSLSDMTDEDLISELEERGKWVDQDEARREELEDILGRLKCGQITDAILFIERLLCPKWQNEEAARKAYDLAMSSLARGQ